MFIYQLEVVNWVYTKRKDWLKSTDDSDVDHIDDDNSKSYTIYFPDYQELSKYIDEITVGHKQYWFDIIERTDGDVQSIEYHNGAEWDSEINIEIKKVRLHESLVESILKLYQK